MSRAELKAEVARFIKTTDRRGLRITLAALAQTLLVPLGANPGDPKFILLSEQFISEWGDYVLDPESPNEQG